MRCLSTATPGSTPPPSTLHPTRVHEVPLPANSLLTRALTDMDIDHEDAYVIEIPVPHVGRVTTLHHDRKDDAAMVTVEARSERYLDDVLVAFVERQPAWITATQKFRNVIVTPIRLRTSPLGCPVSSLISDPQRNQPTRANGRFAVLEERQGRVHGADYAGHYAGGGGAEASPYTSYVSEVLLGANDKHLNFRSLVGVEVAWEHDAAGAAGAASTSLPGVVRVMLANRVATKNAFGAFYMSTIEPVHRRAIAPAMLTSAVKWSLASAEDLFQ